MIKYVLVFILGMLMSISPDLLSLYKDRVVHQYAKKHCDDTKVCNFSTYFEPFVRENPTLYKIANYFILGNGPVYYILSGRCSNRIFYNINAAPEESGKITNREYFFSECSKFNNDVSDLIFGDGK